MKLNKTIYLATFIALPTLFGCNSKQFKVKWVNYDDTLLKEETVKEGTVPTYTGEQPKRNSDEENIYVFSSWDKELNKIKEDTTFKAQFTPYALKDDLDYDGIPNGLDVDPNNNTFKNVKLGRYEMKSDLKIDLSSFVKLDNKVYHNEISKLAVYFAQDNPTFEDTIPGIDNHSMYQRMFVDDVVSIDMESNWFTENVHDIIGCRLAHKAIIVNNKKYDIIIMKVSGSRNNDEWISNFDVGYDHSDYYDKSGVNPTEKYWPDKKLHKGIAISTNRFLYGDDNKIPVGAKAYVDKYSKNGNKPILFILGHSRGAAAAEILGEYFENKYVTPDGDRLKSFTYTFASPNIHDVDELPKTETVFNIVNADDFVPMLPLRQWGLTRIGNDFITKSIKDEYLSQFKTRTGVDYEYLIDIENIATKLVGNRNELYNADTDREVNLAYSEEVNTTYAIESRREFIQQKITQFLKLKLDYFNIVDDVKTKAEAPWTIKVYNCKATLLAIVANVLTNQYKFETIEDLLNFISGCTLVLNDLYVQVMIEFITKTGFLGEDLTLHMDTFVMPHDLASYLLIVDNYKEN